MLIEDYKKQVEIADSNWHLVNIDEPKQRNLFEQLRITKNATLHLINSIDHYKYDLKQAEKLLGELRNPHDEE